MPTDCPSPSCPASLARARPRSSTILRNRDGLRVAVIVNDMSEVNIDAARAGPRAPWRCTATNPGRNDQRLHLLHPARRPARGGRLAREGRFDYLLIEFVRHLRTDARRRDLRLPRDDGATLRRRPPRHHGHGRRRRQLPADLASRDDLPDRGDQYDDDERDLVELLMDQIEFADVIVLNKVTTAVPERLADARRIIRSLNPGARLIETDFCDVALTDVFHTGHFDFEKARTRPRWVQELNGYKDHVPETEEYGIESFVWRARLPFDARRIHAVLAGAMPGVLRAKGWFWVEADPNMIFEYSVAGGLTDIRPLGRWWAATPQKDWPTGTEAVARITRTGAHRLATVGRNSSSSESASIAWR